MLQRYDISINVETDHFFIEEFTVLNRISRNSNDFKNTKQEYLSVQKLKYDGDAIRTAANQGKDALVSAIRSNEFFPIHSYMAVIAERIIQLVKENSTSCSEVFFDDHEQFVHEDT